MKPIQNDNAILNSGVLAGTIKNKKRPTTLTVEMPMPFENIRIITTNALRLA